MKHILVLVTRLGFIFFLVCCISCSNTNENGSVTKIEKEDTPVVEPEQTS